MKVFGAVLIGVWAAFWLAVALTALVGGDVMGMVAFMVIGGLPVLWSAELMGTKRGTRTEPGASTDA